jgi:predicted O-linked N-acetylglucosamine transferase (SPINDLY family)
MPIRSRLELKSWGLLSSSSRTLPADTAKPDAAPDDPELRYNLALAQIREGRGEAALEHTRRLLSSHPAWPGSHAIHGEALLSLGDYRGALREFDWILTQLPGDPLATLKRGFALSALGEYAQAQASFDAARDADSAFVERFCRELSSNPDAPAELCPRSIFLWRRYVAQCDCDWDDRERYIAEFRRSIGDPSVQLDRALVYAAMHLPFGVSERHAVARRVAAEIEKRVAPLPPRTVPAATRRLRIGILSPGLRDHVDAFLLLPLFELADRTRFELYAYSLAPDDFSGARDRIRRAAHRFRDLSALNAADAAQQIRRDEIDILVDAGGHSEGARFEIVAARPAPLQVLYLCFASTLGSGRVDYTILDPVVAPPEHRQHWSERIVYLPDTYFLYDFRGEPSPLALSRAEYGLPEHAPVLCAFHKGEKIDPETFSLWMKILRAHETAVLWLLGDRPKVVANLRRAAIEAGVDAGRLVFCGREQHDRYLARLRLADLYLDAVQHNAIVTACDCLKMGLPVLTLHGSTCTSLSAESLLRAASLAELVAADADDYVARAARLLRDHDRLAALKARLSEARGRAPLFNTAARVRELGAAFEEMWRKHVAGLPPEGFSVRRDGAPG